MLKPRTYKTRPSSKNLPKDVKESFSAIHSDLATGKKSHHYDARRWRWAEDEFFRATEVREQLIQEAFLAERLHD